MSFQTDVLDGIARVVGGTVSANDPRFFNGVTLDGSGIQGLGLIGCYSAAPPAINATPLGIVIADDFDADLAAQGEEDNEDKVRLLILVAPYVSESQSAKLIPFRDAVPAAFRAHMQLFGAPGDLDSFVMHGSSGIHVWDGVSYMGWEFTVRIRRMLSVTYTP